MSQSSRHVVALTVAICFAYAVIRYNVLGPVPVEHIPLFITNKTFSFAAVILLALSFASGPMLRRTHRPSGAHPLHPRRLGKAALWCAGLHGVLSLILHGPAYFPKFFIANRTMTWQAEGSMLAGAVALLLMIHQGILSRQSEMLKHTVTTNASFRVRIPRNIGLLVLASSAVHVCLMGYGGWLAPQTWHGGLPPITLLAFLVIISVIAGRLVFARRRIFTEDDRATESSFTTEKPSRNDRIG